jgi:hypothetical protein
MFLLFAHLLFLLRGVFAAVSGHPKKQPGMLEFFALACAPLLEVS